MVVVGVAHREAGRGTGVGRAAKTNCHVQGTTRAIEMMGFFFERREEGLD